MAVPEAPAPVVTVLLTVLSTLGVPAETQERLTDGLEMPLHTTPVPLLATSTIVYTDGYGNGLPTSYYHHEQYDRTHNGRRHTNPRIASADGFQYVALLDKDSTLILGKRTLPDGAWALHDTGKALRLRNDYHATPSIGIDPDGYLHVAWDHHNNALRYWRSAAPHSITSWTEPNRFDGISESRVTYPHFFDHAGSLFIDYRQGDAANADLVLKRYDTTTQTWSTVHHEIIDGYLPPLTSDREGCYWGVESGADGRLHAFYTWTQSGAALTRDFSYISSGDDGVTWVAADGSALPAPLRVSNSADAILRSGPSWGAKSDNAQVAVTSDGAVHRLLAFTEPLGLAEAATTGEEDVDNIFDDEIAAQDVGFELEHVMIKDGVVTFRTIQGPRMQTLGSPIHSLLEHDDVLYAVSLPTATAPVFVGRSEAPYDHWDWRPVAMDAVLAVTWDVDIQRWLDAQTLSLYVAERITAPYLGATQLQADPQGWLNDTRDGEDGGPGGRGYDRTGPYTSPIIRVIDVADVPGQFAAVPRPTL